jgi:hypothetical protein
MEGGQEGRSTFPLLSSHDLFPTVLSIAHYLMSSSPRPLSTFQKQALLRPRPR